MNIELISSLERIMAGDQVTFEIQGLEPHPDGGTYVVRWLIEPPGSLTPTGETVAIDGDHIYSVFSAGESGGPARATFDVQAENPKAVAVDVRYRRGEFPLGQARAAHRAAPARTEARRDLEATPLAPAGLTGGEGPGGPGAAPSTTPVSGAPMPMPVPTPVAVTMQRAAITPTATQALWTLIRQSTNALSFQNYQAFMEQVLCGRSQAGSSAPYPPAKELSISAMQMDRQLPWRLPFPGVEPYRQLKAATEVFVMLNCGVPFEQFMKHDGSPHRFLSPTQQWSDVQVDFQAEMQDEVRRYNWPVTPGDIRQAWEQLLAQGRAAEAGLPDQVRTILYLALVRTNLPDVHVRQGALRLSPQATQELDHGAVDCMSILQEKLANPCFIELLWSYWQEEAGLVQSMNAITWRFQNRRSGGDRDPLASLEIDPLRPLNNFLWGYIQDEEHRLSVVRRAYEYAHQYGLVLLGKAVPDVRGADNRPRFIESLHNLLHLCSIFYKEDDDTTVVADGFPLLNALKEVHLLLTQGASNQYGDLPWTARLEMLMQQWLLARPEFREFLPRRVMVDYPEEWMSSVETMKTLQGWASASVLHFRDLAVFGEQIVLSVRFQAWPSIIEAQDAANWARYWRPEIQGYIYAYRAVTGVDVTERPDATAPSLLLRERMQQSLPTARTALARPKPVAQLPMPSRLEERSGR
jgi:hypothetical protein